VNARLFLIDKLSRKYTVEPDELPALAGKLSAELESIELDETRVEELRADLARRTKELLDLSRKLSAKRARAGSRLAAALKKEFPALGLGRAELVVRQETPEKPGPDDLTPAGFDRVEFLFCANPGEELRPLRKVASGGELSRIMLCLKNVMSGVAMVPTMVFDEIDVGIGGRVAESVGRRLARLGREQQVIVITHLPQIAKYADHHFVVAKRTARGRTATEITRLDGDERVRELARMSGGEKVTDTTLALAREMLAEANRG